MILFNKMDDIKLLISKVVNIKYYISQINSSVLTFNHFLLIIMALLLFTKFYHLDNHP